MSPLPPNLPAALATRISGYDASPKTIGRSRASVFRLASPGRRDLFLKIEPSGPHGELAAEAERLDWLETAGLPAPRIVISEAGSDNTYLLMTALGGTDLASSQDLAPAMIVAMMAKALRQLHALPTGHCPFDRTLDAVIAEAEVHLRAGLVDESDFDDERKGRSASSLFDELIARRPAREDTVVCHGDACLPNFLAQDGQLCGFVDCGRLGRADRHADLALAAGSIADNVGPDWVAPFFAAYDIVPDPELLDYYRLVDEFF